jgi:hypothetical protein
LLTSSFVVIIKSLIVAIIIIGISIVHTPLAFFC